MLTFIGGCGSGFSFDGWVCDTKFCFGSWRVSNSIVGLVALAIGGGDRLLWMVVIFHWRRKEI